MDAFLRIEAHMHRCMRDSAHDREHVMRVLHIALDIAQYEKGVDYDVLIAACLLHDIGRAEQLADPRADHARTGAQKALCFLQDEGWDAGLARRVSDCIRTHRFRSDAPPASLEAKILFDADKVDVTGAMGVARTLVYKGQMAEPLYTLNADGTVCDGSGDAPPSFLREYRFKLEALYGKFFTARAAELALERRPAAAAFYESLLREARCAQSTGRALLWAQLEQKEE